MNYCKYTEIGKLWACLGEWTEAYQNQMRQLLADEHTYLSCLSQLLDVRILSLPLSLSLSRHCELAFIHFIQNCEVIGTYYRDEQSQGDKIPHNMPIPDWQSITSTIQSLHSLHTNVICLKTPPKLSLV